jgi:hypothetical protein
MDVDKSSTFWIAVTLVIGVAVVYCYLNNINPGIVAAHFAYDAYDFTVRGNRLSVTVIDDSGTIPDDPQAVADQMSAATGEFVSLDLCAVARMLRSEAGGLPAGGKILRAHVAFNDAQALSKTLFETITAGGGGKFGKQAPRRYATSKDAYDVDYQIAKVVISDRQEGGPDLASGATKFVNTDGIADYPGLLAKWGKEGLAPIVPEGDNPEFDLVLFATV